MIDKSDLVDMHRALHLIGDCSIHFFPSAQGTFTKTDDLLHPSTTFEVFKTYNTL